jgi:MFS family permease
VTQALAGFGRGFTTPVLMALSIKHMERDRRATAMGFYQAIYGLGMFAGPYLMGFLSDWLTLGEGFLIVGLFGCVAAGLSYVMLRAARAGTTAASAGASASSPGAR